MIFMQHYVKLITEIYIGLASNSKIVQTLYLFSDCFLKCDFGIVPTMIYFVWIFFLTLLLDLVLPQSQFGKLTPKSANHGIIYKLKKTPTMFIPLVGFQGILDVFHSIKHIYNTGMYILDWHYVLTEIMGKIFMWKS